MLYPSTFAADPFALMRQMGRDLDRTLGARLGARTAAFPAVNVWQNDEAVAITAELPGIAPSDIDITIKDNVLTLSGERRAPEFGDSAIWHRRDRTYGRFSRAIRLPFPARDDQVEARFVNGVLRVVVARPEEDKPRRIEIKAL
ncbi:Hsp20/alpha crystallin family protein [Rhodovulum sp. MB263]|uniref:Hsp20/alpha crystallin family protein n=1 Tax=Rhodovulum sp. (strain MB263) TaxID=308754 RepID=UPI0009B77106|nr:Hsp20/alpha crystallin family protein [Rhodovulum sp. MB263]ARC89842.1 heat-shock protein Hsp20 [Rhodovulum sp. MB263]